MQSPGVRSIQAVRVNHGIISRLIYSETHSPMYNEETSITLSLIFTPLLDTRVTPWICT